MYMAPILAGCRRPWLPLAGPFFTFLVLICLETIPLSL